MPFTLTSAMVITENSITIRSLLVLRDEIDRPPQEIQHKSIQLYRSEAEEVATIINELIAAQNEAASGSGSPFTRRRTS